MDEIDTKSLRGKLLIATPWLSGSIFEKSIVYVCYHGKEGAMGIVVNSVINSVSSSDILAHLNIPSPSIRYHAPVHLGGPVEASRGFILHTDDYASELTRPIDNKVSITCSTQILKDIAIGRGPNQSIIALGYTGWDGGKLEDELMNSFWVTAIADRDLIFDNDHQSKWKRVSESLGIDFCRYVPALGNA